MSDCRSNRSIDWSRSLRAVHGLLPQLERSGADSLRPGSAELPTPSISRRSSGPASSVTDAKHCGDLGVGQPASALRCRSTASLIASACAPADATRWPRARRASGPSARASIPAHSSRPAEDDRGRPGSPRRARTPAASIPDSDPDRVRSAAGGSRKRSGRILIRQRFQPAIRPQPVHVPLRQHGAQPRRQAAAPVEIAEKRLPLARALSRARRGPRTANPRDRARRRRDRARRRLDREAAAARGRNAPTPARRPPRTRTRARGLRGEGTTR